MTWSDIDILQNDTIFTISSPKNLDETKISWSEEVSEILCLCSPGGY